MRMEHFTWVLIDTTFYKVYQVTMTFHNDVLSYLSVKELNSVNQVVYEDEKLVVQNCEVVCVIVETNDTNKINEFFIQLEEAVKDSIFVREEY